MKANHSKLTLLLCSFSCLCHAQGNTFADQLIQYNSRYPQEKIYVHTDKPYYMAGDTLWFRAYLTDAMTHRPASASNFIYLELHNQVTDSLVARVKIKRDSDGVFANGIPLPGNMSGGSYMLSAYTDWMRNFDAGNFFYKQMRIASYEDSKSKAKEHIIKKISLDMMPEGGQLIAGVSQRLAYKVIADNGMGIDAETRLVDSNGKVLSTAPTIHRGMGYLYIEPEADEKLYLEAYAAGQLSCRKRVPKALTSGASIMVNFKKNHLLLRPLLTADYKDKQFDYLIYGSGNAMQISSKGKKEVKVALEALHSGVVNIAMVDHETQQPLAERLIFVRDSKQPRMEVEGNEAGKRQLKTFDFELKDANLSDNALLSVAVNDAEAIQPDSTQADIRSSLLLSSELKGYIEDPDYYFKNTDHVADASLDLLMMTQGWRRYDTQTITKSDSIDIKYPFETSQYISGKVSAPFSNSYRRPEILIWSPKGNSMGFASFEGKVSKFRVEGLNYSDSTLLVVSALTRAGKGSGLDLVIDRGNYPKLISQPNAYLAPTVTNPEFLARERENQKWLRIRNTIYLPEVSAFGTKSVAPKWMQAAENMATKKVKAGDSRLDLSGMDLVLQSLGLQYKSIEFERNMMTPAQQKELTTSELYGIYPTFNVGRDFQVNPVAVYINDSQYFDFDINLISPEDVSEVYYFKRGNAGLLASRLNDMYTGALYIYLKPHGNIRRNPAISRITPLGYKKPAEFYNPEYKVEQESEQPDKRTTLYWSPKLKVDKSGKAHLSFYTSDVSKKYLITLEGILKDGTIINCQTTK